MNMELRGKLANLGVNIPLAKIMEGPSIFELSETILNIIRSTSKQVSSASTPTPTSTSPASSSSRKEQEEQEQKKQNEEQSVVMKPSFIQEHFVKVYAESGDCNDCHLAGLLSFASIDPEILQVALNQLIEAEISLRTRFETSPSSKINAVVVAPHLAPCKLTIFDYSANNKTFNDICDSAMEDAKKPFDLSKAPLLRAHLYKYARGWVVYTIVHHAVLDGVSMLVLWRSLFTTYHMIVQERKNNTLISRPTPSSNYKDYVEMEAKYMNSDKFASDSSFWKKYLHNMDPLQFPSYTPVSPSSTKHTFTASKCHFVIPSDLVCDLSHLICLFLVLFSPPLFFILF